MTSSKLSLFYALLTLNTAGAAATSVSFWAYDQYAENSPYYSHYGVSGINTIDLNDRGWGFSTNSTSSYHVSAYVPSLGIHGPLRTIGWHQYEFAYDDLTQQTSILMDGSTILSGPYNVVPSTFYFGMHDYYGGTQETVIDDFEVKLNGSLVYQQNFESATMPDGWSISGLNPGTYINSGDPSTPHSGSGSLAIGATTGGDLGASIVFDLASIPEPSSIILGIAALGGMALSRNRPKSS